MSSINSRSKLPLRAIKTVDHNRPQATIDTQGAPLASFLLKILGASPASAIARGNREYDKVREFTTPNVLIMEPISRAILSHGPTTMLAIFDQLPVDPSAGARCVAPTAAMGIMLQITITITLLVS